MLSFDAGEDSRGIYSVAAPPSARAGGRFAALSHTAFASRYLSWSGASGKSYVFSVYPASDCPAFCDAVMLAVATDGQDGRRALAAFDTGAFPEPVLARAQREHGRRNLELHVHLLSRDPSERRAALADLESAVAPVRAARR